MPRPRDCGHETAGLLLERTDYARASSMPLRTNGPFDVTGHPRMVIPPSCEQTTAIDPRCAATNRKAEPWRVPPIPESGPVFRLHCAAVGRHSCQEMLVAGEWSTA